MRWLFLLVVLVHGLLGWPGPAAAGESLSLTNVQRIRELSFEAARGGLPVKIRGVITFHDAANFLTYVQDDTAGIYATAAKDGEARAGLEAGQWVEVEGVTSLGSFSPIVWGARGGVANFTVLGRAAFPRPVRLSNDPFSRIAQHCQWIETEGLVRSVTQQGGLPVLELVTPQGRISAFVTEPPAGAAALQGLVAARVTVQGVFSVESNFKMQSAGMRLLVPSAALIRIERPAEPDPFTLAVRPIEHLLRFNLNLEGERIRVHGTVTWQQPREGFFIRDTAGGVWVQSRQADRLRPGDEVDVVGFPGTGDGYAILEDAVFRRIAAGPAPLATRLDAAEVISGGHHAELVSVVGTLVEHLPGVEEHVLVLQSDTVTVHLCLPSHKARKAWKGLRPGSRFQATGVALLRPKESLKQPELPLTFRLRLRGPDDLLLVRSATWLTSERIFQLLALSVVLLVAASAWVVLLRRQVSRQTAIIQEHAGEQAVLDERARIARELHDSLGQDMAGVTIQLDTAAARLPDQPAEALAFLNMARAMMRHAQSEARRSVWSLRARELHKKDLPAALRALVAAGHPAEGKPRVVVQVAGVPRRLPAIWETHLLRIAQEAVNNAVHYAAASVIDVELIFGRERLILRITDDGRGFAAAGSTELAAGHFGLLGMRERAEKMNGVLTVSSSPGQGTTVRVEVAEAGLDPMPASVHAALSADQ